MLLDPPHPRLEVADGCQVAETVLLIIDHGAAKADDLIAELFAGLQEIGGHVGDVRLEFGPDLGEFGLQGREVRLAGGIWRKSAISARICRRICRTRLSGSPLMRLF
jgi:hypothetical protein